jgi:hypothetical protein
MARLSVSDEKIHKAKSIRFGTAGCRLRQIYSRKISQLVSWSVFLIKKKNNQRHCRIAELFVARFRRRQWWKLCSRCGAVRANNRSTPGRKKSINYLGVGREDH